MSDKVEASMDRILGTPTTCPHGNPIPGSDYVAPDARRLSDLSVGVPFTVSRIPEELEFEPGLLEFLETSSIQPGHTGTVTAASPDGTVTVEIAGQRVGHGSHRLHPATEPAILATLDTLLAGDLQRRPRHGRLRLDGHW